MSLNCVGAWRSRCAVAPAANRRPGFFNRSGAPLFLTSLAFAVLGALVSNVAPARAQNTYSLSFFNVDDVMTGTLNGTQVLQVTFNKTGSVNLTPLVAPGFNTLNIQDYNFGGGYTWGYSFLINGVQAPNTTGQPLTCGTVNVFGCNNNDQNHQNQVVFNVNYVFCNCTTAFMQQFTQSASQASTQQSQSIQNQQLQLTQYLTQGGGPGGGPGGTPLGGPAAGPLSAGGVNPFPGLPTGPGGPASDNPDGGSDLGSGGFNAHRYPYALPYGTLTDPSGGAISQYAPQDPLPGVFKAMPPVGSRPAAQPAAPVWSGFLLGTIGGTAGDGNGGGAVGVQHIDGSGLTLGGTIGATVDRATALFGGVTKTDSGSVNVFASRVPDTGWQWLVIGSASYASLDLTRGYLNAGAPATSEGGTHSNGLGAVGRLGFGYAVAPSWTVTPFASYALTNSRIWGYTESSGPLPMQFNNIVQTLNTTRLGGDARYTIVPGSSWLFGELAWAHQFEPTSAAVSGTVIGVFPLLAPGTPVDQDWLEATGGAHFTLTKDTTVTGSLTTAAYPHSAARYLASVSLTKNF